MISRAFDRACGSPAIDGNEVRLLIDSTTLDAMVEAIDRAQRWVHFENYIIRDDATGMRFADRLIAARRRGAAVRVLYDSFGCRGTGRAFWHRLSAADIEVRAFNPVNPLRLLRGSRRDHRKYLGVDGLHAIVGGLCIGDEWTGDPARRRLPWRDTAVALDGPIVSALERSCDRLWAMAGTPLPPEVLRVEPPARGEAVVRLIDGVPGSLRVFRTVQLLASGVAERLWVTEAYLLAPAPLFAALIAAARDGTDVRLLLPGQSDIPPLRAFTRVGYRELLRAGVRIFEWRGPMLHAKTVLGDARWFKVGSSNLNPSSLQNNYELDVLIDQQPIAEAAGRQFRLDLGHASEIVLRRPLWMRGRLADRFPPSVPTATGEYRLPELHRPSAVERTQRVVVTLRKVAEGARRSIAGATVFGLMGIGLLLVALPQVMAYFLAFLCFTFAGSAAWTFLRERRIGDE